MRKFVRTRAPAPPAPAPAPVPGSGSEHRHTNGHAAGVGVGVGVGHAGEGAAALPGEPHSTLSGYRSGSSRSGGGGGGGGGSEAPWEDAEFPCTWRALGDRRQAAGVRWLRPHELCARPRFRGDTALSQAAPAPEPAAAAARRWRVTAGAGGAALPAAAAALAATPRLLSRVAPHQSFRHGYTGAFTFNLWVFGAWCAVVVDDRLPTRGGRLLSARCDLADDFTLPLLEKAFAKLAGGYGAARRCGSALAELTGGVVQELRPARTPPARLLHVLRAALSRATLLVATTDVPHKKAHRPGPGPGLGPGLEAGRPYEVVGVVSTGAGAGGELVRVRAAGTAPAFDGDERQSIDGRPEPGHFWVPAGQFGAAFPRLELVHVPPDDWLLEPALRARTPWRAVLARRRWRAGYNAGGPPHAPTTGANPQFRVSVRDCAGVGAGVGAGVRGGEAGAGAGAGRCHAVVSVSQRAAAGVTPRLAVGFAVYELPPGAPPGRVALPAPAPAPGPRLLEVTHSGRAREVAALCALRAGEYLVVPHAARPHAAAAFLLRLFTDTRADVWEVNEDNIVLRTVADEFRDHHDPLPYESPWLDAHAHAQRGECWVEAGALGARLGVGRGAARALLVLRDGALAGRVPAAELGALRELAAHWRRAFRAGGARRRGGVGRRRASTYSLRAALAAAGVRVSNKVLECLVLRFARGHHITEGAFLRALARIHLAHERYRKLESKMKSTPLSLEEMILMTIYT